ncbi:MAG: anti-sigma factor [Rhodococcus sp. (in: high G+C Gram-positive bacteria)]|uniref:anti-sigma factor n=1 Tax=Rhodococcus sp. TaxID=1831 RepID=UPI003BB5059B
MTNSTHADFGGEDLLGLAAVYALDAVSDAERREIDARVAAATPVVAAAFEREVRDIRETMAQVSRVGAVEPPERVRDRLLDTITATGTSSPEASAPAPISLAQHRKRRRNFLLAAAAAVIVAVGAVGLGSRIGQDVPPPTSAQILAADDVRTTSGSIEGGGTATVVYSKEVDAGVLVMNNVAPPTEGTVYQMWLLGPDGPTSAGTMTPADVAPSTTAVLGDIAGATGLGFSIEPTGGSPQPTNIFAELPLT